MAKMTVNVDNKLDDVKLESTEKLKGKKKEVKKEKNNKKTTKKKSHYLDEVGKEMALVSWPSKKDVVKYSIATVLMIIFLAVFFIGISAVFDALYNLVQGWLN